MIVGQDQMTGRIYLISGNTKLEFPGGGNPDGSSLYASVLLDMIHQAYPEAPMPRLVALNPDVVSRIPDVYSLIDAARSLTTDRGLETHPTGHEALGPESLAGDAVLEE